MAPALEAFVVWAGKLNEGIHSYKLRLFFSEGSYKTDFTACSGGVYRRVYWRLGRERLRKDRFTIMYC